MLLLLVIMIRSHSQHLINLLLLIYFVGCPEPKKSMLLCSYHGCSRNKITHWSYVVGLSVALELWFLASLPAVVNHPIVATLFPAAEINPSHERWPCCECCYVRAEQSEEGDELVEETEMSSSREAAAGELLSAQPSRLWDVERRSTSSKGRGAAERWGGWEEAMEVDRRRVYLLGFRFGGK